VRVSTFLRCSFAHIEIAGVALIKDVAFFLI
jgi:hypothetical protein